MIVKKSEVESLNMSFSTTGWNNNGSTTTTEYIPTRKIIQTKANEIYIESCLVSDANYNAILAVILCYGLIFTTYLCLKGTRTFHRFNMEHNEKYQKALFCDRFGIYFSDMIKKRNVYIILMLHIWNQASDIGVIVEMYYLSFSECSLVCIGFI